MRSGGRRVAVLVLCFVCLGSAGCMGTLFGSRQGEPNTVQAVGTAVTTAGKATGNPFLVIGGGILSLIGMIGAGYYGRKEA